MIKDWGGEIGLLLAKSRPNATVLALGVGERSARQASALARLRYTYHVTNLLLAQQHIDYRALRALAAETQALGGAPSLQSGLSACVSDIVVLSGLGAIVESDAALLPQELEQLIGVLLELSVQFVVPDPLPDLPIFSYWADAKALLRAASKYAAPIFGSQGKAEWSWVFDDLPRPTLDLNSIDTQSAKANPFGSANSRRGTKKKANRWFPLLTIPPFKLCVLTLASCTLFWNSYTEIDGSGVAGTDPCPGNIRESSGGNEQGKRQQ